MAVIGRHQGKSVFTGKANQRLIDTMLLGDTVRLKFQKIIAPAKAVFITLGNFERPRFVTRQHRSWQLSTQAGRETDKAFAIFFKTVKVHAGAVIISIEPGQGVQLHKIMPALLRLGEKNQVIRIAIQTRFFILHAAHRNIEFAAQDRLDPLLL